ncbi:hypothetical protein [Clostridium sporogenes]|uniref:hypothetical protein n=1 Tax=Clostridium sporogenes TaxID=1509 RepID=UPI0006B26717|nr:hypothetical protein [Clostridium sporogenes]KOY66137.1 hypothetical protein AN649_10010 [Clostridium sporogenes]MDS1006434.1 hypothetical protein [Clostridium sporogenes]
MKIKDIKSRDNSWSLDVQYAINLGLTGEEEIKKHRCVTRGTSSNYTYECLLENGDTFMYQTAGWDGFSTLGYPYLIKKDSKKDYAKQVGKLARKYNFDFDNCLTLGTEEKRYSYLKSLMPFKITKEEKHVLEACGISRRIECLENNLGEDIFGLDISCLGQMGSLRLADLVLKNCMIITKKEKDNILEKAQKKSNGTKISTKEYCLAISSANITPCLGKWGAYPLLPDRMPKKLPDNWENTFACRSIEVKDLENTIGYIYEDYSTDSEFAEVIPLPLKGLVYIKDICFMYKGEVIRNLENSEVISWNSESEVYIVNINIEE